MSLMSLGITRGFIGQIIGMLIGLFGVVLARASPRHSAAIRAVSTATVAASRISKVAAILPFRPSS